MNTYFSYKSVYANTETTETGKSFNPHWKF